MVAISPRSSISKPFSAEGSTASEAEPAVIQERGQRS